MMHPEGFVRRRPWFREIIDPDYNRVKKSVDWPQLMSRIRSPNCWLTLPKFQILLKSLLQFPLHPQGLLHRKNPNLQIFLRCHLRRVWRLLHCRLILFLYSVEESKSSTPKADQGKVEEENNTNPMHQTPPATVPISPLEIKSEEQDYQNKTEEKEGKSSQIAETKGCCVVMWLDLR